MISAILKILIIKQMSGAGKLIHQGLRYSLIDFYHRYHKPLFIVENGIGIDEQLIDQKVYELSLNVLIIINSISKQLNRLLNMMVLI
ncbi:MAG: hypothetical protein V8R63_06780 [Thomasclavelia ramosa]